MLFAGLAGDAQVEEELAGEVDLAGDLVHVVDVAPVSLQLLLLLQQQLEELVGEVVGPVAELVGHEAVRFQPFELLERVHGHHFFQLCQQLMHLLGVFVAVQHQHHLEDALELAEVDEEHSVAGDVEGSFEAKLKQEYT